MSGRPISRTRGSTGQDGGVSIGFGARLVALEGAPTDGVFGTGDFADIAGPGSILTDVTNKKVYTNTGTLASPVWTVVGTQS